ncbi:MAG: response regulator [Chitinophagaceae bacterium]|nr:response regulator [Chitinophagaceae bacterium]
MNRRLNCIMLVDDNPDDNFFHERVILKNQFAGKVIALTSGYQALEYLKTQYAGGMTGPELIFLDINMPGMNGWEFLNELRNLQLPRPAVIIMLTTSENPLDKERAAGENIITDFRTKPLSEAMLAEIIETHFDNDRHTG